MLHRLIEAIKVTCFGISRRPCAKHRPIKRKTTYQLLLIGLFHKLISVQDAVHNMLHLHFAQQLTSLKVHAPVMSYLSYHYKNDAELNRQFPFDTKENIARLTHVTYLLTYNFCTCISKWSKGTASH